MTETPEEDKAGYGKPPTKHQFQKGKSGNPKGRPRGKRKLLSGFILAELEQKIEVTENGRKRKMTKGEAIAKTFINSALKNDIKVLTLLTKVMPELDQILMHDENSAPVKLQISWIKTD